jgi:hypothetical protein
MASDSAPLALIFVAFVFALLLIPAHIDGQHIGRMQERCRVACGVDVFDPRTVQTPGAGCDPGPPECLCVVSPEVTDGE